MNLNSRYREDLDGHYNEILEWIKQNKTKKFIYDQLKCSKGTLNRFLKRNNIEYHGVGRKIDLSNKQFYNIKVIKDTGKRDAHRAVIWKCQCLKCGDFIEITTGNIGKTKSCAKCSDRNISRGILNIEEILKNNNILYQREKIFKDCLSPKGHPFRFDFYVDNKYLIEYDGEQHFYEVGIWRTKLEERQLYDKIKNE